MSEKVPNLLPRGPFGTVLADPPWEYETKGDCVGMERPYASMPTDDICSLKVGDIAAEDSVLFLWVTNRHVPDGCRVMEAWGFRYRECLVWDKVRSGAGTWLKGQTELLFIGKKGGVLPPNHTGRGTEWTTLHREVRSVHSKKPGVVYRIAEDLGPAPRIELFARSRRAGWSTWGNQVSPTAQTSLEVLQ